MNEQAKTTATTIYKTLQKGSLELSYDSEPKIRQLVKTQPEQLQKTINYLYVLLNVKAENRLSELEESVLNGSIVSSFNGYSLNEIKHAFRLALAGTLPVKLYNKLDSIILSQVMNAYKNFKTNKLKTELNGAWKSKKPTTLEIQEIEKEFIESVIVPLWEQYEMNEKWTVNKSHWLIYDLLNKKGLANLSSEVKKGCMRLAEVFIAEEKKMKFTHPFSKVTPPESDLEACKKVAKSFALKQLFFELKLSETNLINQLK